MLFKLIGHLNKRKGQQILSGISKADVRLNASHNVSNSDTTAAQCHTQHTMCVAGSKRARSKSDKIRGGGAPPPLREMRYSVGIPRTKTLTEQRSQNLYACYRSQRVHCGTLTGVGRSRKRAAP